MKKAVLLLIMTTVIFAGCGKNNEPAEIQASDDTAGGENTIQLMEPGDADEVMAPEENAEETDNAAGTGVTEDTEGTRSGSGDMTDRDLFADFIMGKGVAEVADDFLSANVMSELKFEKDSEFTISEMEDVLAGIDFLENMSNPTEVSYAPLECHGEYLYAMSLFYETDIEPYTEYFIFSDHSGKLELKFAADRWTRRDISINEAGIVSDSGSNGAGSHSYTVYAPDKDFTYKMVSHVDENYYGYSFYDEEGNAIEALNATIEEAGEGNPAAMDVAYYSETINGKTYYYFLGGGSRLTQDTVNYIDGIAKGHGFTFDGRAAADEARMAYEEELGISDVYGSDAQPRWKEL